MKKYISLFLLSVITLGASSCYKNARKQVEENNNSIPYSKWDWNGIAPLSYNFIGNDIKYNNPQLGVVINVPNKITAIAITEQNAPTPKPIFGCTIMTDIHPGVYHLTNEFTKIAISINAPDPSGAGPLQQYTPKNGAAKVIVNDEEHFQALFFGQFENIANGSVIEVKNGYINISKAGAIYQE